MDTLATFKITSKTNEVVFSTEKRYARTNKPAEENKMLRDLAKMRKELTEQYDLGNGNRLSVCFTTKESNSNNAPAKKPRSEKNELLSKIKALDIETMREVVQKYCL